MWRSRVWLNSQLTDAFDLAQARLLPGEAKELPASTNSSSCLVKECRTTRQMVRLKYSKMKTTRYDYARALGLICFGGKQLPNCEPPFLVRLMKAELT